MKTIFAILTLINLPLGFSSSLTDIQTELVSKNFIIIEFLCFSSVSIVFNHFKFWPEIIFYFMGFKVHFVAITTRGQRLPEVSGFDPHNATATPCLFKVFSSLFVQYVVKSLVIIVE